MQEEAGDMGLIPGLGRLPRGGKGNPLRYSFLENSKDRQDWWAAIHGVSKSQDTLSNGANMHIINSIRHMVNNTVVILYGNSY